MELGIIINYTGVLFEVLVFVKLKFTYLNIFDLYIAVVYNDGISWAENKCLC